MFISPIDVYKHIDIEINTSFNKQDCIKQTSIDCLNDIYLDKQNLDLSSIGKYKVKMYYKYWCYTIDVQVVDTTPPKLLNVKDLFIKLNSTKKELENIEVFDNSLKKCKLYIDDHLVNYNKVGQYQITYKAIDDSFNEVKQSCNVYVCKDIKNKIIEIEESEEKVVYLTFDDGPSSNTKRILDILERYNVLGTFFVCGDHQEYNKYISIAYNKGHTIGLHCFNHDYQRIYKSVDAYFNDLDNISKMVTSIIGKATYYLRFPGGSSNQVSKHYNVGIMSKLTSMVGSKGYRYFDWNISSGDALSDNQSVSSIIERSINSDLNNIMLLFHDTKTKNTTVEALPSIIQHYKNRGYIFKAIDDQTFTPHQTINN